MFKLPSMRVLRERDFRLLLGGRITSQLGNQITVVALAFGVLDLTGSASDLGLVLAVEAFSLALFLVIGGAVADRMSRRRLMITADLVRFASQGVMAALLISGHARIWHLLLLQVVSGIASAFFIPAVSALQPETVPAEHHREANALRGLMIAAAGVVGPALGGLLVVAVGAGYALALDSLSFLLSAVLISAIRVGSAPVANSGKSVLRDVRDGWQDFRSRRWLWPVTLQSALVRMLGLAPFMVLGPLIAKDELGGPASWGLILGAISLGAFVGGFVAMSAHPRRPLIPAVAGAFLFVPMLLLLSVAASPVAIAAVAFLGGIAQSVFWTYWQTAMHENVPPETLSRISSYDWLGAYTFEPIGYALAGPASALIGASATLVAGAGAVAVGTAATLAVPEVRRLRARSASTEDPQPASATGGSAEPAPDPARAQGPPAP
ncbi:MFS transporter [Micromonospora sp. NPDC007220]|uniref:MFS transporter n=1 Tax=Micromonospora sp. NPDC007220 TaxID=3154318 RepID=UPI0033E7A68E